MRKSVAPALHLLRAFITTARAGTISSAAELLHLTQGAVSKQVQELEQWLGVPVFERAKKRLHLTTAGHRYLQAVQPLLQQLDAATIDLMSNPLGDGALHLSSLPTFGAKWLIPRLPGFQAAHPKVTLHFVPYVEGYDFLRPDLDCAIRYGTGSWPRAEALYIIGREMVLIAPPASRGGKAIRKPADIRSHVLLHHQTVPRAWESWCGRHGPSDAAASLGPQFDQYQTLIRAVSVGMGIGLVPACLVQQELALGEVISPLPHLGIDLDTGYYLCYPPARAEMPALADFKAWLLDEVRRAATEA